jgi:hypothetical protein
MTMTGLASPPLIDQPHTSVRVACVRRDEVPDQRWSNKALAVREHYRLEREHQSLEDALTQQVR